MQQIAFKAQWTPENCSLQYHLSDILPSPFHSLCQKVYLCCTRVLSYISEWIGHFLHQYTRQYIVGGMRLTKEEYLEATKAWKQRWEGLSSSPSNLQLRLHYEPCCLQVTTPDGLLIEGTLYRSLRSSDPDIPTIICHNPNWTNSSRDQGWDWLLHKGAKSSLPFHVIVFEYRACAGQEGLLHHPRDLTLDADTFYQLAKDQLHVSEANIHFLGFCTGAQVAATLAALHPHSGRVIIHNSTYNLADLVRKSPVVQKEAERKGAVCFCCLKEWISTYITWSGWAMDITEALNKINSRTLFTQHVEDHSLIPELRAYSVVKEEPKHIAFLKTKASVKIEDPEYGTHWLPLPLCEDETGLGAPERIVNFILGQEMFSKKGKENQHQYIIRDHRNRLKDIEKVKLAAAQQF